MQYDRQFRLTFFDNRTAVTDVTRFTLFIYCFYFVCAAPLNLSGLRHVNLDVFMDNNNTGNVQYASW